MIFAALILYFTNNSDVLVISDIKKAAIFKDSFL